ncbi:Lipid A export ATP-binding/permease protein MsbA [Mycena sanguinolenta]|uniref:Lipid A export ATP-binding/permease protein MsbA n=1 Tax=Mycena sanguinolenta TaxID=230812 RepID=A0A8H7DL78_9AGAR|nr:Lipid A export ATP-binding/permease protein MsbA [Mycena sanguinolenta]
MIRLIVHHKTPTLVSSISREQLAPKPLHPKIAMEKKSKETESLDDYSFTTLQHGVWRTLVPIPATTTTKVSFMSSWSSKWNSFQDNLPVIWWFLWEIYSLDPRLNLLYFLLKLGSSVEGTLMLYASSRLLQTVEIGLTSGRPDINAVLWAVGLRVACTALTSANRWALLWVTPVLQSQIAAHFEEYMLQANVRLDLPTSADKNNAVDMHPWMIWYHYQYISGVLERASRLSSQIIFTVQQPKGGITLTLLSLVAPILSTHLKKLPWKHAFLRYASNFDYLRLQALKRFVGDEYREDIQSGNLAEWIVAEYKKSKKSLGNIADTRPEILFRAQNTPITDILMQLCNDLPTFYWATSVILEPKGYSITTFAILQQHANALRASVVGLFNEFSQVGAAVSAIQELYKVAGIKNKIADGDERYPNSTSTGKGMAFELKNVSFAYPGGKSKENAIRNVSLKIPAGHLVVVVGANGSGKSTIIKLLNRLYDVDSGEILVDGTPIQNYRLSDLREVQAMLCQDHKLFPLSIAENIGLGNPDRMNDLEMVLDAAEAGGASEVIKKLKDGVQAVLDPVQTATAHHIDDHKKLKLILENLEQRAEVSGGEKQRLVAARTFMRFFSGKIRFAVADEPSSALDPKAEHQLFQRLRESGEGKTMIFVTHRFGHLTKYADLIVCMKDGQVVETGTHKELMALDGEYSELYNVQAQAFSEGGS